MLYNPLFNCPICQDKRKFESKLNDAKRILYRLKDLKSVISNDFEISDRDLCEARHLPYHSHLHFMCGHCREVNTNELIQVEDDLLKIAYTLYLYAKSDNIDVNTKGRIKSDCQRLLSGYYPAIANLFYKRI